MILKVILAACMVTWVCSSARAEQSEGYLLPCNEHPNPTDAIVFDGHLPSDVAAWSSKEKILDSDEIRKSQTADSVTIYLDCSLSAKPTWSWYLYFLRRQMILEKSVDQTLAYQVQH